MAAPKNILIEPPQVFYCDRCGLFNPLEHLRDSDLAKIPTPPEGKKMLIQLQAAECPQCGGWVSPMSSDDIREIGEVARRLESGTQDA